MGKEENMLTKCPECSLQVSDKALSCPHCGYPFQISAKKRVSTKRMRLPNGFGSITEVTNKKLRNPFYARVCVGKTETGRPILKALKPQSYFDTYNHAYEALVEYHKNPYDLERNITVKELYDKWSEEYFESTTPGSARTIKAAWNYCSILYDMRVCDVRSRHIKGCINDGKYNGKSPSPSTKEKIKSLFNLLLDYAREYEIVSVNYARTFSLSDDIINEMNQMKRSHMAFTDEELKYLWENVELPYVDMILIMCYTGFRPQEFCSLRVDDLNIQDWYIHGGMKTNAGRNRLVPIHSRIRDLILKHKNIALELQSEYLFNSVDAGTHKRKTNMSYDKLSYRFSNIMRQLSLNSEHRPHDCRKTFVTMAKKYEVNDFAIKRIVGHSLNNDITEAIYTDRSPEWLASEIEKIK